MKKIFIISVFLLGCISLKAQNINQLMGEGKSFMEIRKIMYEKYEGKSAVKGTTNYDRGFKQFKRWEYFWQYRLMPDGSFPNAKIITDAWKQLEAKSKRDNNASLRSEEANWEYFGPQGTLISNDDFEYTGFGRINAIESHPTNHDILIAGPAGSGIWKSTDKGLTWSSKMDNMPNLGISDIVFDPNNADIIYAASGDADGARNPHSTGLLKSMDLGETWSIIGTPMTLADGIHIRRLAMPTNPSNTILATTTAGVLKSTDGGENFSLVGEFQGYDIEIAPYSDSIIYIGGFGAIYKSIDTGDTWTEITPTTLGDAEELINLSERIEIGVTPADSNYIVAFDQNGLIIKSNDGGNFWERVTSTPSFDSQSGYNMAIAISPNDKNTMIIAAVNGWRTQDGGNTWVKYLVAYEDPESPFGFVHPDHHDMSFFPGGSDSLLLAHDGGVHYGDITQDDNFVDISAGLYVTQYYGVGVLRDNSTLMLAGAQDNDMQLFAGGNEITLAPGDGYDGMINYEDPNIMYASITQGITGRTMDGFNSFEIILDEDDDIGFSTVWDVPMLMHPTNPSTIFYGGNMLIKSDDHGDNWDILFPSSSFSSSEGGIIEIELAPSNPEVITFASFALSTQSIFSSKLRRSTDNGATWTEITPNVNINGVISGIATHPTNPDVVYVSYGDFVNYGQVEENIKVFKTTDGGQNWTNVSQGLPNIPINDIAFAVGTEDLYIGTYLGVFVNLQGADEWTPFNTDLPYVEVMELEFDYANNKIIAATYGRGIWTSSLASPVIATNNLKEDAGISIYPNPTAGKVHFDLINSNNNSDYDLTIYNLLGGVVYTQKNISTNQVIDLESIPRGTYLASVRKGEKYFTQKLVIHAK